MNADGIRAEHLGKLLTVTTGDGQITGTLHGYQHEAAPSISTSLGKPIRWERSTTLTFPFGDARVHSDAEVTITDQDTTS